MLREKTVFGPIHSRRLGNSLGINLLPEEGKLCNFDCIYCECGWNRDGHGDTRLPSAREVRDKLDAMLRRCAAESIAIDSITFSGDGEPTLNPDFAAIIDDTLRLRDRHYPAAQVSVLTNATRADRPDVAAALRRVDNAIMKIDAPTNALAAVINRPAPGYDVARVVESLKAFDGRFVLQTCMLRCSDYDSTQPAVLDGWMDIVRTLRPRRIMVYTVDRATPRPDIEKLSPDTMRRLVQPLLDEGFQIEIYG
ncbi:MAG: Uncharacterized protein AUK63_1717 [bacterium P3]|nr:MAG: Uncharacterized protein AUK63_1717 [bacterium P3]KWW38910.1 MAG: Uncharacterized protein F083_2029 [bacterium F083]